MPSARLAKALVEKRREKSFEENGEAWGRLETRVVASLLEMYEMEEMARFFGGEKGDFEAKEKDDSGEEEKKKKETKTEKRRTPKCADCLRAAGATGGSTS